MHIPKIVYQTTSRWLVVYKPRGWSLASRGAGPAVESFLAPVLRGESRLYFPFELDSRSTGLGVICTDRGMQSQFERFKVRDQMRFKYSIRVKNIEAETPEVPPFVTLKVIDEDKHIFEISSGVVLPFRRFNEFRRLELEPENVHLYSIEFPDPFQASVRNLTISIPENPPEGWKNFNPL
jgi:hypothetical protein